MLKRFIVKMSQAAAVAGVAFAFVSPAFAHWTDAGKECVKYDCEADVMVNTCRFPVQVIYGCDKSVDRCHPASIALNTGGVGSGESGVKDIGDLSSRQTVFDVWGSPLSGEIHWPRDILSPGESKNIIRTKSANGKPALVGYASAVPDDGSVYSVDVGMNDGMRAVSSEFGAKFRSWVRFLHTHEDGGFEHISSSVAPHFQCLAPPVALRALRGTPPPGEKLWDPREREGGDGRTHLHIAAATGEYEAARWLIANGADVNANEEKGRDRWKNTPLHHVFDSYSIIARCCRRPYGEAPAGKRSEATHER